MEDKRRQEAMWCEDKDGGQNSEIKETQRPKQITDSRYVF